MTASALDRLAAAAPPVAAADDEARRAVLEAIVAGELVAAPARARRTPIVALAGVIAVAATALVVARDHPQAAPATTRAVAPAPLTARIRLAMAASEHLIVHVRTDYSNGVLWEGWFDKAGNRFRTVSSNRDGSPIYDLEQSGGSVKVVSYNDRAWWTYELEERDPPPRGALAPDDIRTQLANGTLKEMGRETVNGRAQIHLRWDPIDKAGLVVQPGDLWVDEDTYLPVRQVSDGGRIVIAFEWVAADDATTAKLVTKIPPGFRQLPGAPEPSAESGSVG